jgi:Replication-relaxation
MPHRKFKLTKRDSALLVDLYKHRFLTIGQLQQLHFPSKQTAYRRTRQLKDAGYISSFTVANIDESIFMVAPKGSQAVAEALGVDLDELKWTETKAKPRDYYFMRHFLAINDFRITLRLACEASGIKLLGFIPDYYGEKTDKGGVTKYIRDVICDMADDRREVSHTPDGVFALERDGKQALFFLEIDRGTEVVSDPEKGVLKSVRFYANYLLDGKYQRYALDFGVSAFHGFRSLYVTTTDTRVANIRQAATSLSVPVKTRRFTWITTNDKLTQSTIFTPIWHSLDSTDESKYQIG